MLTPKIIADLTEVFKLLEQINGALQGLYGNNSKEHKDKFTHIFSAIAMQRYAFENRQLSPADNNFLCELFSFKELFSLKNGVPNDVRPSWDEYQMSFAITAALRSSCHSRKVGSVIVQDNHLKTTGYNGADKNMQSCKAAAQCQKEEKKRELSAQKPNYKKYTIGRAILNNNSKKACVSECAESTALSQLPENSLKPSNNGIIYSTLFPCESCAAKIIKAGFIQKVVYKSDYNNKTRTDKHYKQTLQLFKQNGIEVQKLRIRPQVMQMIIFNLLHPDGVSHELIKPNEFDPLKDEAYELTDIGCENC